MNEEELKMLFYLSERNEIIQQTLSEIHEKFKILKKEVKVERNILKLLGEQDKFKKTDNLLNTLNRDLINLKSIKTKKEKHQVEKIDIEKFQYKKIFLFEDEYDFEKIKIQGVKIKDDFYKVDNLNDLIITVIKIIEKNNYFINYIAQYQTRPYLILNNYNFHIHSVPFVFNNEEFYVNKKISIEKTIKDLLDIIGRNKKYHYDDILIITNLKPKKKHKIKGKKITLDMKQWSGKKPTYYVFNNNKYKVKSWIDLFTKFLSSIKKDILSKNLYNKELLNGNMKNFMYLKPDGLTRAKEISLNKDFNIYIRGNHSAQSIKKKINFLIEILPYNKEDFYINVKK